MQIPSNNHEPLSKREYFAVVALQGLLASTADECFWTLPAESSPNYQRMAKSAVMIADQLISQLETTSDSNKNSITNEENKANNLQNEE